MKLGKEKERKGEREKGRKGEREKGRKGEREKGRRQMDRQTNNHFLVIIRSENSDFG